MGNALEQFKQLKPTHEMFDSCRNCGALQGVHENASVAAYLGMMGMELNPQKCGMATTEGVPGLQLCLCPHLENPCHWVPSADSVPFLALHLQPDGDFFLQRKHRLRLFFFFFFVQPL